MTAKRFAWLVYPIVVAGLTAMLAGGSGWYPWIPAGFALTAAALALLPSARNVALASCTLWIAFALAGIHSEKYYGPLGFAALITLLVAATEPLSPKLAASASAPAAFVQAAWLASLARQATYELASVGRLTSTVDPCATYFLPLAFGVLVCGVAVAAASTAVLRTQLTTRGMWGGRPLPALQIAIVAGVLVGAISWRDWQTPQPCL